MPDSKPTPDDFWRAHNGFRISSITRHTDLSTYRTPPTPQEAVARQIASELDDIPADMRQIYGPPKSAWEKMTMRDRGEWE